MRAYIPKFNLINPKNLDAALNLLANEPKKWKAFAGGTDLMVLLEFDKLDHYNFINLWDFEELRFFEEKPDYIRLGALSTYSAIKNNKTIKEQYPLLVSAASLTAARGIQNRGTIGGNIVNASPAADTSPVLLAYNAELELISKGGTRSIPYKNFHLDYKKTELKENELLFAVKIPCPSLKAKQYFRKVGPRKAMTISKLCLAALAIYENKELSNISIAVGSLAPKPLKCEKTEALLNGKKLDTSLIKKAKSILKEEISPIDDIRSTKEYRETVAANLLEEFLIQIEQGEHK